MSVRFFYYKSSVCKGRIRLRYMEGVEFAWNIFTVSLQSEIFDGTCYREERFLAAAFGCCKKKKKNQWLNCPFLNGYTSYEFNRGKWNWEYLQPVPLSCFSLSLVSLSVRGSQLSWPYKQPAKVKMLPDASSYKLHTSECFSVSSRNSSQVALPAAPQELPCSIHNGKEQRCVCSHVPRWPSGTGLGSFCCLASLHGLWLPSSPCASLALLPDASVLPWHVKYTACSWAMWDPPYSCPFPWLPWKQISKECSAEYWLLLEQGRKCPEILLASGFGCYKGAEGTWLFLKSSQLLCSWS